MENDDELASLVGSLVKTAQALLKKQGGVFLPFPAFINPDGAVEMLGADSDQAQPASNDLLTILHSMLQSMSQRGRHEESASAPTSAFACPATMDPPTRSAASLIEQGSRRSISMCRFGSGGTTTAVSQGIFGI
jgi:hypothetical protein